MKTQTINNQLADATPGDRACYFHTLSLVERVLSHFLLDPGSMNMTINRQINDLLLRFACNTDLGPKTLVACSINDNFCTAKLYQKVQIMLAVLYF